MSQGWNVAILGCNGLMGQALIDLLESHPLPLDNLYLLARDPEHEESRRFNGRTLHPQVAQNFDWHKAQLAFFVAGTAASAQYIQAATRAGCLVIDTSGLFSGMADVPLIVPTINDPALAGYRQRHIIATASSLTCQLLLCLAPLLAHAPIRSLHVTSLLPAAALGKAAIETLAGQSARLLNGQGVDDVAPFSGQLAFNALPFLPDEAGSVAHERRLIAETRRILGQPDLPVSASCAQIPAFFGQLQMVNLTLAQALTPEQARNQLADCPAIELLTNSQLPTPVSHGQQRDRIALGCLRDDPGTTGALQFCSVADNLGIVGALTALQTAQTLLREHWC